MVDDESTGSSLQLTRFSNFLLRKLSHEFKLRGMSTLQVLSNGHISVLLEDRVTRLGMLICNIKVTGLQKFRKLPKIALF